MIDLGQYCMDGVPNLYRTRKALPALRRANEKRENVITFSVCCSFLTNGE